MSTQIGFEIEQATALEAYLQGKHFQDENEFLEMIEDYFFGKMIVAGDTGEHVREEDIFKALEV